jgi:hypothetical protein
MKRVALSIAVLFIGGMVSAQTAPAPKPGTQEAKTDSIAQKVILFMQQKQPDSVYALAGKSFREKITAENFNSISRDQILQLTDFKDVSYVGSAEGVNIYKITGEPVLRLLVGLDAENKIETLLVQPYPVE